MKRHDPRSRFCECPRCTGNTSTTMLPEPVPDPRDEADLRREENMRLYKHIDGLNEALRLAREGLRRCMDGLALHGPCTQNNCKDCLRAFGRASHAIGVIDKALGKTSEANRCEETPAVEHDE